MIAVWCVGRCYWRRWKGGKWSGENRERENRKREMARKRIAEVEAERKRAEEANKKTVEEHDGDAPNLGVFKLQEQTPLNVQQATVTDEDVDGVEDAPPSYDWEADGSRYDWERGESSHEEAEHVSDEERGLLKGLGH